MFGIESDLSSQLDQRLIEHKERFIRLFYGRYMELLPNLITYQNNDETSIDFLKIEVALRSNYNVVVGLTNDNLLTVLGFVKTDQSSENPANLFMDTPLTKDDIEFIVPPNQLNADMKEISYIDNCSSGDFVVLRNKTLQYVSDMEIIKHYTYELAEIVLSRYSISMQAKINTFFTSDVNDETITQLVSKLYNGSPYIKIGRSFDPKDNIHTIANEFMASNFTELKREYQNKISELNNMLGINSLAVEKSSGVSDTEAKSNKSFTTSNANIYLDARNNPLEKLNRRFKYNIEAVYNDEVESEFNDIANQEIEGANDGIN